MMDNPSLPHKVELLNQLTALSSFEEGPPPSGPLWYLGNDRELPVIFPHEENGMQGYCDDDKVYVIRHEDGSIETAPIHMPYRGKIPDFGGWKRATEPWKHTLCGQWDVFGMDRWEYLYVRDPENRFYIISPGQDRYQRIRLKGQFAGWYLNAHGQMCIITDNFGFDLGKKNIIRVYRVTPIMDET